MKRFEIGECFETTIVAITDSTVFLDLNAKSEGVLDKSELMDENNNLSVKEGDLLKVYFTGEINGEMQFTTKISGTKADSVMIENAWKNKIPVEGNVTTEIKGGFEVKIGSFRAFCPYSQMGFKKKEEPSFYIGKTLSFIITEYKNEGKNILVSNKIIGESEYQNKLGKLANQITETAIISATVESIEKFGAFVNILGFRALLPISEISYNKISDVSEVLEVGQELKVQVLHTDWKNERVSVSLKSLLKNPWDNVENDFSIGTKIDGKISRIVDFGIFVNIANGIDGLVHISDLEDVSSNTNLHKVYKIGQKMSVVIEKIDSQQKRISLKPASSQEQDESAKKYLSSCNNNDGETYNPFATLLIK